MQPQRKYTRFLSPGRTLGIRITWDLEISQLILGPRQLTQCLCQFFIFGVDHVLTRSQLRFGLLLSLNTDTLDPLSFGDIIYGTGPRVLREYELLPKIFVFCAQIVDSLIPPTVERNSSTFIISTLYNSQLST
ncbi:hypothetical protein Fot_29327 [Forsythia ovata]|uniref:Uncharacterized protein n=1 Tax=Forsythia ovata TaxID=205694 RepID=A0ABD1TRL4_9LAMI